jgi:hypothetical protein
MDIVWNVIKWVANAIMVLVLFFGLLYSYVFSNTGKAIPTSVDDLAIIPATVQSANIGPGVQTVTMYEYAAPFESKVKYPHWPQDIPSISTGAAVNLYISALDKEFLKVMASSKNKAPIEAPAPITLYGVTRQSGEILIDPKISFGEVKGLKSFKQKALSGTYAMIFVPLIYFGFRSVMFFTRRKRRVQIKASV